MSCSIGEQFTAEVRDVTSAGQGVAPHPSGRVFFVSGVWIGERGVFEITELRGRTGQARIVSLEEASTDRVEPVCAHHGFADGFCGGCPWQFVSYDAQLRAKQQRVEQALAPLLNGRDVIRDIRGSEQTYGYRNRAQLRSDGERLGYLGASSHQLADVGDCPILNEHNRHTLHALREQLPNPAWRASRGGRDRHRKRPNRQRRGRRGAIEWTTLHIDDALEAAEVIPGTRRPFRQGNSAQNTYMRDWLRDQLAALTSQGFLPAPALELFAGSGNFTKRLVEAGCDPIVAVDSFGPALEELVARQWPGVSARAVDLARADAWESLADVLGQARLLVLDPPRDGLPSLREILAPADQLAEIVYVSCDVATFTRDVRAALDMGFVLEDVQPLDLFPQTPHVEILSRLSRR